MVCKEVRKIMASTTATAYQLPVQPIILKKLAVDCGITQKDLCFGVSRPLVNLILNRAGYLPIDHPGYKEQVELMIDDHERATQWLIERNLRTKDIWEPLKSNYKNRNPAGMGYRANATRRSKAAIPGDATAIFISAVVDMVNQETLHYFKMFRNPFIDDIQKDTDVYLSEEHRYIKEAMVDAARHGGFLAVIGEVGSGKSVMRRMVVEQLKKDGDVLIIYPQIIDKTRLNAASICDAIIMDISDQKPRIKLEQKTRQVQGLLLERSQNNYRSVLIIEEAHDLHINTLKYLKRFYELEDGYKKLLGIILIGQTELKRLFDESTHVEMREVIRRIQVAEIRALNGNVKDYLSLKFKRVGARIEDIFSDAAIQALGMRLTRTDRFNKKMSHAYPLVVNNYASRAMNLACERGEE